MSLESLEVTGFFQGTPDLNSSSHLRDIHTLWPPPCYVSQACSWKMKDGLTGSEVWQHQDAPGRWRLVPAVTCLFVTLLLTSFGTEKSKTQSNGLLPSDQTPRTLV